MKKTNNEWTEKERKLHAYLSSTNEDNNKTDNIM